MARGLFVWVPFVRRGSALIGSSPPVSRPPSSCNHIITFLLLRLGLVTDHRAHTPFLLLFSKVGGRAGRSASLVLFWLLMQCLGNDWLDSAPRRLAYRFSRMILPPRQPRAMYKLDWVSIGRGVSRVSPF